MNEPLRKPPEATAPVLNVANGLTVARLLMVPVFLALLLSGPSARRRVAAFAVFAAAALTDQVDGRLARELGVVTDFGKVADPLADKALTGAALLALSGSGRLPWWATGVVLARESAVTALRFSVIRRGVIPASRGGKAKALAQNVAIGLYVLPLPPAWGRPRRWALGVALALTVVTGADYVRRAAALARR